MENMEGASLNEAKNITLAEVQKFDILIDGHKVTPHYHKGGTMVRAIDYDILNNCLKFTEQENRRLKKELKMLEEHNQWRDDWESVAGKDLLIKHSRVKPFFVKNIHQDEIEVHKSMSCIFKIIEP